MALSATAKANIANLKICIESAKREIESCNATIKNNNARKGSKSAGDYAKVVKKSKQEKIKEWRAQIARIRKND